MDFLIPLTRDEDGAYVAECPAVPGCTGYTREEVEINFREALEFHFEGMREAGLPIPEPSSEAGRVSVAA